MIILEQFVGKTLANDVLMSDIIRAAPDNIRYITMEVDNTYDFRDTSRLNIKINENFQIIQIYVDDETTY